MMMDTDYKKLQVKKFKQKPLGDDQESRYWKSFKEVYTKECSQSIRQVASNANTLGLLAFSDGLTVEIYSTTRGSIKKTLSRFNSGIYSLAWRKDGQLLAVGQENGQIDIYNQRLKLPLRMFRNFKKPVQAITFNLINHEYMFAASDDGIVKQFDITAESVIRSIPKAHSDFIRSIKPIGGDQYHLLTGGYDHKINVFDFRNSENTPVLTFDALEPVESMDVLIESQNFISVQGTTTTLWDFRLKSKIQDLKVNQKTLTDVKVIEGQEGTRIMTSSLDHQIKFIRPDIFKVTHQVKMDNPLMSIDCSMDGLSIITGDSNGKISVISRLKESDMDKEEEKQDDGIPAYLKENPHLNKRIKNFQYFNRGIYQTPENVDITLETQKKQRLGVYDKLIIQFKYKEALIKALQDQQSQMVVSICEELISRGGLEIALNNLDATELGIVIGFIGKKIINPKFQETACYILNELIDKYPSEIQHHHLDVLDVIQEERKAQQEILKMSGIMELLLKA